MSTAKLVLTGVALLAAAAGASAHELSADVIAALEGEPLADDIPAEGLGISTCKTVNEKVGNCDVSFRVCGKLYGLKWRYTANACASGKCASSGRTKSAKGAAEDAAKALFVAPLPACAVQQPALFAESSSYAISSFNAEAEELPAELAQSFAVSGEAEAENNLGISTCKTVNENVGNCAVSFRVCGKLYGLKWRYTANACASGKCASSGRTKSAKGAAEDAAKALFTAPLPACAVQQPALQAADEEAIPSDQQDNLGISTCKTVNEKVGNCDVSFRVCGKLYGLKWRYTANACASGKCASSGRTKSAKGAAEDAAKALFVAPLPACALQ